MPRFSSFPQRSQECETPLLLIFLSLVWVAIEVSDPVAGINGEGKTVTAEFDSFDPVHKTVSLQGQSTSASTEILGHREDH